MSSIDKKNVDNKANKRFITIGNCSKFNLYILGSAAFKFLSMITLGDKNKNIGLCGFSPILYSYYSMQSLYAYFGYIIIGIICYYFFERKNGPIKINSGILIYNNPEYSINSIKTKLYIFLICFFFVFYLETENLLYSLGFQLLNYWTCETIFSILLMKKYFIINFSKHHKFSLIFIICSCSICLLIASFLPNSSKYGNDLNCYQIIQIRCGNYYYSFLFIIFFAFLSFTYSFSRTFLKVIMQAKFISANIFIIFIGVIGVISGLAYAFVLYYLNFENNIIDYFKEFNSCERNYKFYIEIFLINPLFICSRYMQLYLEIQTIFYLNPIYGLLINNLCFGIQKLIEFIIDNFINIPFFIFSELSEIFAIIGYIFYLEILELNFCGLSDDLKRRIVIKGEIEVNRITVSMVNFTQDKESEDESSDMTSKRTDEESSNI